MQSYFFVLGRENKISQKELLLVLASFGVGIIPVCHCETGGRGSPSREIAHRVTSKTSSQAPRNDSQAVVSIIAEDILEIKLNSPSNDVADLINILGGTVKIYQKIASGEAKLVDLLKKEDLSHKVIFGLSNYTDDKIDCFKLALGAKKSLGKSIRVVAGKEGNQLSSAQSFQYKMDTENIEYGIFDSGWGKLIAVQNIDEWTRHDYGKPRSDAASGMLPPKLARTMANLALSQINDETRMSNDEKMMKPELRMSKNTSSFVIRHSDLPPLVVDPFCGSGNILLEALSLGCDVVGMDISEKAVDDTKANINWLMSKSECRNPTRLANGSPRRKQILNSKFQISKQDATKFDFSTIDRDFIIVTEPYLGQPRRHKLTIEEELQMKEGATKFYLNFLKNLKLKADSSKLKAICIVFPLFELANGRKLSIFSECLDFIRQIGYDIICPPCLGETSSCKAGPPMEYGRDYQIVKREIVLLKLKA